MVSLALAETLGVGVEQIPTNSKTAWSSLLIFAIGHSFVSQHRK
jgi:hypothetical protein